MSILFADQLKEPIRRVSALVEERRAHSRYGALPPGPIEPPILQLPQFLFTPRAFVHRCHALYGTPITLRFPGVPPVVQFFEPAAVREVFTGAPEELYAGESNIVLEPLLGKNSLLLLDGEKHAAHRKLLTPPFRGDRMRDYGAVMRDVTRAVMKDVPEGRPVLFHDLTQRITLEVIFVTVFGAESHDPELGPLRDDIASMIRFGTRPELMIRRLQLDLGPRSPWRRFLDLMRRVRSGLGRLIARRRSEGDTRRTDMLSLMLRMQYDDGAPLGDDEIADELLTLLVAGHETTATGLAWAAHRLIEHPEMQDRARDEVRALFPDEVDPDRVAEASYLHAFGQEVLRVHPVVPGVGRKLQRDCTIGGVKLPEGVIVGISILLAHDNPDVFPEPVRFRPERFLERRPSPFEYFPFGGGVRRCIGMTFAVYETDVVLATILREFRFVRHGGERPRTVRRSVTLAPSDGMPVVLERVRTR